MYLKVFKVEKHFLGLQKGKNISSVLLNFVLSVQTLTISNFSPFSQNILNLFLICCTIFNVFQIECANRIILNITENQQFFCFRFVNIMTLLKAEKL